MSRCRKIRGECKTNPDVDCRVFSNLPVWRRGPIHAQVNTRLEEAGITLTKASERVKEAQAGAAASASLHNAEQPFVLLPDVLQNIIIDLLPIGR